MISVSWKFWRLTELIMHTESLTRHLATEKALLLSLHPWGSKPQGVFALFCSAHTGSGPGREKARLRQEFGHVMDWLKAGACSSGTWNRQWKCQELSLENWNGEQHWQGTFGDQEKRGWSWAVGIKHMKQLPYSKYFASTTSEWDRTNWLPHPETQRG